MTAAVLPPPTEPHLPLPDKVRANSGHVSQSQLGWLRPTTMDTSLEEMKHRFSQDNYLYLKGALPRDDVLKMREHYFSQFTDTGLLDPSRPIVDGAYNADDDPAKHLGIGGGDPLEEELARLTEAHRTETYRKFVTHSALTKVVRDLMGWDEEVLLTRTMLRHNVPGGTSTGKTLSFFHRQLWRPFISIVQEYTNRKRNQDQIERKERHTSTIPLSIAQPVCHTSLFLHD